MPADSVAHPVGQVSPVFRTHAERSQGPLLCLGGEHSRPRDSDPHRVQRAGDTAVSTIWRILMARGFVTPQPNERPKSSYVRFAADQPNQRWQTDITNWTLADGTDLEILHWLDDHSRLLLASTARRVW